MAIRLGTAQINAKQLGANALNKIMLGVIELFPNIGGVISPTPEDLFTGANQGLYYDLDDDMQVKMAYRRNMLFWSEDFNNAVWQTNGVTKGANTQDPLGGNTAITVIATAISGHVYQPTNLMGAVVTNSIWVRRRVGSGQINLMTPNNSSVAINVTATWARFDTTNTSSGGGTGGSFTGVRMEVIGDEIDIAFSQCELGQLTSYQKVTDWNTEFLEAFPDHALFQEARGVIPVTSPLQPLGLVLDKSDTSEWGEVVPTVEDWTGQWQNASANWTVTSDTISWNGSGASGVETIWLPQYLDESYMDRYVKLTFTISNYSGTGDCGIANGVLSYLPNDASAANIVFSSVSANGTYTMYGYWRGGGNQDGRTLNAFGRTTHSFTLSDVKVEKAFGKHFTCVTTANRFQWNPGRMTYNGVNSRGTAYAVQFAPVVDYSFFMGVTCRNTTAWPEVYTFGAEGVSWGETNNIGGFHFQQGQCLPHLNGEADPPRSYMQTQPVVANTPISLAYKFNYGAGLPNAGMPFYQSYGGGINSSFSRIGVAQVGSVPSGNFNMGGILQGGSAVLDGDVYQFVMVFRDTTTQETTDTQDFINNKIGVTP